MKVGATRQLRRLLRRSRSLIGYAPTQYVCIVRIIFVSSYLFIIYVCKYNMSMFVSIYKLERLYYIF